MKGNAYVLLARYILPQEFEDHFELNDVSEEKVGAEMLLHLYLEEKDEAPEGREDLIPNGYYDEMRINDFPIRDHRTVLHIRRRRWQDKGGKTREARQGRQDSVKRLAISSQRYPPLQRVRGFFKRIPWIHPRLQPDHWLGHIT